MPNLKRPAPVLKKPVKLASPKPSRTALRGKMMGHA